MRVETRRFGFLSKKTLRRSRYKPWKFFAVLFKVLDTQYRNWTCQKSLTQCNCKKMQRVAYIKSKNLTESQLKNQDKWVFDRRIQCNHCRYGGLVKVIDKVLLEKKEIIRKRNQKRDVKDQDEEMEEESIYTQRQEKEYEKYIEAEKENYYWQLNQRKRASALIFFGGRRRQEFEQCFNGRLYIESAIHLKEQIMRELFYQDKTTGIFPKANNRVLEKKPRHSFEQFQNLETIIEKDCLAKFYQAGNLVKGRKALYLDRTKKYSLNFEPKPFKKKSKNEKNRKQVKNFIQEELQRFEFDEMIERNLSQI